MIEASVIAVPWVAPAVPQNCFKQVWPDFATVCLRNGRSDARIVEARLVTSRR
jgi:hypothetical protein